MDSLPARILTAACLGLVTATVFSACRPETTPVAAAPSSPAQPSTKIPTSAPPASSVAKAAVTTPAAPAETPAAAPTAATGGSRAMTFDDAQEVGATNGVTLFESFLHALWKSDLRRLQELGDFTAPGSQDGVDLLLRELKKDAEEGNLRRSGRPMAFKVLREVSLPDGDAAVVVRIGHGDDAGRVAQRIRRVGTQWRFIMGARGPEEVPLPPEKLKD